MTIEHSNITDPNIHEPKGASTASLGSVYTSDGLGSGLWQAPELAGQSSSNAGDIPVSQGNGVVTWSDVSVTGSSSVTARSNVNQDPSTTDTPLQVVFDSDVTSADASITAAGVVTIINSGLYMVGVTANFGRDTSSGTAKVLVRLLFNDVQLFGTVAASLETQTSTTPYSILLPLQLPAGTTLKLEIARDSSGSNDGGLKILDPTLSDWVSSSSIGMNITRLDVG